MKIALESAPDYSPSGAWKPIEIVLPASSAGLRLDQALSQLLPQFSRSRIALWIREQRVEFHGAPAQPKSKVHGGETVRISPAPGPEVSAYGPEAIALSVVYEDDSVLVIDKPPGLVVHPGSGNWSGTLLNALLAHAPELAAVPRAGIVHRLDKDTSGLLVVAKTLPAQTSLVRQLQARTVTREYLALACGTMKAGGSVDAPIGRHPVQRTRMAVVRGGKPALTHYDILERYAHATLLRCKLESGRTHQIRVHLQSIGHPLVGDPVYGRRHPDPLLARFARQALHAQRLEILHPVSGERAAWHAPTPPDFQALLDTLSPAAA